MFSKLDPLPLTDDGLVLKTSRVGDSYFIQRNSFKKREDTYEEDVKRNERERVVTHQTNTSLNERSF